MLTNQRLEHLSLLLPGSGREPSQHIEANHRRQARNRGGGTGFDRVGANDRVEDRAGGQELTGDRNAINELDR
jgi:hypothetical protein